MESEAQRALEAFTSDLELVARNPQAAKGKLEERDRDLQGKIRTYLETLAASATTATKVKWSVQFSSIGYDLHVGATAVRVWVFRNDGSSSSFRVVLSAGDLAIDGDFTGHCARIESEIWDLVARAFRSGMGAPPWPASA